MEEFDLDAELDGEFGPEAETPAENNKPEGRLVDRYEAYRKDNPGEFPDNYTTVAQFKAIEERESVVDSLTSMNAKEKQERQDKRLPEDKPQSAIQPSKAFDSTISGLPVISDKNIYKPETSKVDYSSMHIGQKESQEKNGVRDHGLGLFDQAVGRGYFEQAKTIITINRPELQSTDEDQKKGNIEWEDDKKEEVVFIPDEEGKWIISTKPQLPNEDSNYITGIDPASTEDKDVSSVTLYKNGVPVKGFDVDEPETKEPKEKLVYAYPAVEFPDLIQQMVQVSAYYGSNMVTEKTQAWVGIDPGKKGGIVAIDANGIIGKWVIPLLGDDVDAQGVWDILARLKEKHTITLVLEEVHSLFGMSAATNFSMGHTLGILLGIIVTSKIRLIRINPKSWQKEIWQTSEIQYKPLKTDQKKASVDTKLTSMKAAHRLFPNADFRATSRSKNDHDGITDAACLAEYGRRKNL